MSRYTSHFFWTIVAAGGVVSAGCNLPTVDALTQIKQRGEIHFLTRNSSTTYYEGVDGPTGLEYDLMKRFADQLGVNLRVTMPENFANIIPMIATGQADIAAAGLTVTDNRRSRIRFGPAYQQIRQEVIYRAGRDIPSKIEDLVGKKVVVVKGSSHESQLRKLARSYPALDWESVEDRSSEELIAEVWKGTIDFTVADSNEMAINQPFYPEARSAFSITGSEPLAWGISPRPDNSLDRAVRNFFEELKKSGELDQLLERYYSHTRGFNYTETRILQHHIKKRLMLYLPYFKEAGDLFQIDWRFLAAIGYQESHWRRRAISPTGVRGIMMLTLSTASQVGVKNRLSARQSIMGGAEYFRKIHNRIPYSIPEPDRTLMALAAYNMGLGHLKDLRKLTRERGEDSMKWVVLKKNLPLLQQKRWYKKTRHGYARGNEAKNYVENIWRYYVQLQAEFTARGEPQDPRDIIDDSLPEIMAPAI